MSEIKELNYPPQEIFKDKKNHEYMILWMLYNNDYCVWGDFFNEPLNIKQSTLSGKLRSLIEKECIVKIQKEIRGKRKQIYRITKEGKKRYNSLSIDITQKKKRLSYPPKLILDGRNHTHIIVWMLYNNDYCKWKDFIDEPLKINSSTLSKKINRLLEKEIIKKDRIPEFNYDVYRINTKGKIEYSIMLELYDLDRQSILEDEIRRIKKKTSKTLEFFKKHNITDDDIKFRFLHNILKLDFELIENVCKDEDDFMKIIYFISLNHPKEFPNYITLKEFSEKYKINKTTLKFFINQIVEENFYNIKFFKLKINHDNVYYFHANGDLEKHLRVIVERVVTKLTYLNQLYMKDVSSHFIITKTEIENKIIEELCKNLFNRKFEDSLREFLDEYINYLKYNIERKDNLKDVSDRLEGVVWYSLPPEIFEGHMGISDINMESLSYKVDVIEKPIESELEVITYYTKLGILRSNKFKTEYFEVSNYELLNDIEHLLNLEEYEKVKELLEEILHRFNKIEVLILKTIINSYLKNYDLALHLASDLIEKKPKDYVGYLLHSKIYEDMKDYDKALKEINKVLKFSHNTLLVCQKTQILAKQQKYDMALEIIEKELLNTPKNIPIILSKSLILKNKEEYNLSLDSLNEAIAINDKIYELFTHKGITLNYLKNYDDAIKEFNLALKTKASIKKYGWIYANLAISYENLNDFTKALEIIDTSIELDPNHINSHIVKAEILYNMSKYDAALNCLEYAIKLDSKNPEIYTLKALIFKQKEDYPSALKVIKKAILIDPDLPKLYNIKIDILRSMKKYNEALELIEKGIKDFPDYFGFYSNKARILKKKKNYEDALSCIEKAISIEPDIDFLYSSKAKILIDLKRDNEALKSIDKSIELDPNDINFYFNKIRFLYNMSMFKEALSTIEVAFRIDKNAVDLFGFKAHIIGIMQKKYKEALNIIEEGIKIDENYSALYEVKSWILFEMFMYQDALKEIEKSIEIDSEYYNFYIHKANILKHLENYSEALNSMKKSIELKPENPESYYMISTILYQMERYEESLKSIEKGIKLNPEFAGFYSIKAKVYFEIGGKKDALNEIKHAISLDPEFPDFYVTQARCFIDMKNYKNALDSIKKGLKIDQNYAKLYDIKGFVLFEMEQYHDALSVIDEGIKIEPDFLGFYWTKSMIYNKMRKLDEELENLNKVIETDPNFHEAKNNKAITLSKLNRKEEALDLIQSLIEANEKNGFYYDSYGEILIHFDDYKKALKQLEKALDLNPKADYLHETYIKIGKCHLRLGEMHEAVKYVKMGEEIAKEKNDKQWMRKAEKYLSEIEKLGI